MATNDPITVRVDEIEALADRLMARGEARMLRDMPELQADLKLAARLLRYYVQTGVAYLPIVLD